MRHAGLTTAAILIISLAACDERKTHNAAQDSGYTETVTDSTVYGVCGTGTSMHSVELVTDDGDTLVYAVYDAPDDSCGVYNDDVAVSKVCGGLMAGDRIAVMPRMTDNELVAARVVNITSLLGHWTSIDRNFVIEEGGTVTSSVKTESNPWTSWKILNGRLLLNRDTFDIAELGADSLFLENKRGIFAYKRQR